MIEDIKRYYSQAHDLGTWFASANLNLEVAELLFRKYNSSNRRLALWANEHSKKIAKKRRINIYHLTLYKHILMFFGLALECYLKGILIKTKVIVPLNNDGVSLSYECTQHLSKELYEKFEKLSLDDVETIKRLRRAIDSGKYPIEKRLVKLESYTSHLDQDVKTAKRLIRKIKKGWDKFRFPID